MAYEKSIVLRCNELDKSYTYVIKSFNGEKDDKNLFNLLNILQKIIKSPFNFSTNCWQIRFNSCFKYSIT